jgi:cytochrome c-type biogenesis protein CcmH
MMFWILAGLLSAIVMALFAWPLIRPRRLTAGAGRDLAVYRDQLGELDREVARGLVPEAEAAAARLEIQRRLLAAAQSHSPKPEPRNGGQKRRPAALALLLFLLPAAAVAIYLDLGTPGLPSLPFASPPPAAPADQELAKLVAALDAKMQSDPSDPKGWFLLAGVEAKLGRFKESAEAYAQAISRGQAKGQAPDARTQSLYGEALTAAADGQVTPEAKAAFAAALALDAKEPRARFYTALADAQAGHLDGALTQWVALEADSPPDAPWRDMLTGQIEAAAKQLGRDPATLPGRNPAPAASGSTGPTPEDVANAANMTAEQRAAFIDSMVSDLASRLRAQPGDVDGWLKLANAYDQLGRADDARAAWREAANRAPDRLDAQLAYAGAVAPVADRGPLPADFAAAVARIRKLAPSNALGLYCAGLLARANGDKAAARALWQQVLPLTPEGSPQRKELEAKIAALGQ